MSEPDDARGDASPRARLRIVVRRSGGIAGMTRTWVAEPGPDDEPRLRALLERCPWDAAAASEQGADRFRWEVSADGADASRRATFGDAQNEGPWRELIDAVRADGGTDARSAADGEHRS